MKTCLQKYHWLIIGLVAGIIWVGCGQNNEQKKSIEDVETKHGLIKKLSKKIDNQPRNAELYYRRGKALQAVRKTDLALKDLKKAVQLDSTNTKYLKKQGALLVEMEQFKQALDTYHKVIELDPENTSAKLSIAKLHHYLKNYQKVIDYANEVLKQDVHNAKAYFLKGVVYKEAGDTTKALSNFQTATEQDPDYSHAPT
jgi:tetratricopeptide (TPR) repeat protein